MDQNKLRRLAGLPVIAENTDLRNNANFQSRMLEKFEHVKDNFAEIQKFIDSADFDKFLDLHDAEAARAYRDDSVGYSNDSAIFDIVADLQGYLENAQTAMDAIYEICSGTKS